MFRSQPLTSLALLPPLPVPSGLMPRMISCMAGCGLTHQRNRREGLVSSTPHTFLVRDSMTPLLLTCWKHRPRNGDIRAHEPRAAPDQAGRLVLRDSLPREGEPMLGLVRKDKQGDFMGTEESNITCKAHGEEGKSQRSLRGSVKKA